MFNRKKIEKLEAEKEKLKQEIGHLQREKKELENDNAELREKLDSIKDKLYSTPKDCKLGRYCQACEFGKLYVIHGGWSYETIHVCGRDEACPNFVAKEDVKVKEVHKNDKT